MRPTVNAAAAAVALAVAAPASAQVLNAVDQQSGIPAGIALPVLGVAVAEEPSGMNTTPAAPGFVRGLTLQYFGQGGVTEESHSDGVYAATALGPLGIGYSIEWMRPGGEARRFRKNTLALALGDGRVVSFGVGWNWFSSPDPAVEALQTWDLGLTIRPWRHLSIAAARVRQDARLGGQSLPARYDLGLATRFLRDTLTLSADLLADDTPHDFHPTHLAFGAGADLWNGLGVAAQILVPLHDQPTGDPSAVVALSYNWAHFGVTGGAAPTPASTASLGGLRLSTERYRAASTRHDAPTLDLQDEMSPKMFLFTIRERDPYGKLLQRLEKLKADKDVSVVVLKVDGLPLGPGRVEEMREIIASIRERKPVVAYVLGGGTREYWLATAATAVGMPPGSTLTVNGVSTSNLYLKNALARIGVAFEVVARGAYKSAPEPLVRTGPSPEASEETNSILDGVYGRFVEDVALARRLSPQQVRALVDQALLTSEEAKVARLVDEILWPDQLEAWASQIAGRPVERRDGYEPERMRNAQRWGKPPVVEIIRVEGTIVAGKSRPGPFGGEGLAGAETIGRQLRRAADDGNVKAIVLRVDSPGGDGLASDLILREVIQARARKPVIASMGDYAASGGYLVAVGASDLVAEPSTLTGSIGVFTVKPDLSGLLGKLSVTREAWTRGENAQVESIAKPWSPTERRAVERQIDSFYKLFVERVAEGRGLPPGAVETSAGGRVWTGRQALDRHLVDRIGSLEDAIALALQRAHLSAADVEVRRAGGGRGDILDFAEGISAPQVLSTVDRALASIPEVRALALLSEMGPVVALPVEWVVPRP